MDDTGSIRLLLVSRHALIRAALARLIAERPSLKVVGEAGTQPEALQQTVRLAPDVLLLDLHRDRGLWLDAIAPLATAARPHTRVLLLSGLTVPSMHREALRLGARGILDLDQPAEALYKAIERVHAGEVWMDRRLMAAMLAPDRGESDRDGARLEALTPREREILQLIAEGLRNKQVAARLSVTDVTVRHHLTSIFAKLDVTDRLSLVVFAFRHGLADPAPAWHKGSGLSPGHPAPLKSSSSGS